MSTCPVWCERDTPDADGLPEVIHHRDFPSGVEITQWHDQPQPEIIMPTFSPHTEVDPELATEVGVDLLQAALMVQGKGVTVPDLLVALVTGLTDRLSVTSVASSSKELTSP